MTGYGSIEEDEHQEPSLESISSSTPSSSRSWVVQTISALLIVACFSTVFHGWLTNLTSGQPNPIFQLVNPVALWGSTDWKTFIRQQNDPNVALYHTQIVDHNDPKSGTFLQRYYEKLHYWEGPGHPLFLILGGESPLEQILYPFVSDVLAKVYGGVTFNPEHRYYGKSYPVMTPSKEILSKQMTPKQAMQDFAHFIQAMQAKLGCGPRGSDDYCPVITVGGSYPGLLSVLMRINFPETVDIGYGGGVPLHTWDNSAPVESAYIYYDYITSIAEQESPGCPAALKATLLKTLGEMKALDAMSNMQPLDISALAAELGVCSDRVPSKIKTAESLAMKLIWKVPGRFSSTNMEYYPPGPTRLFIRDCKLFQNATVPPKERFRNFLIQVAKTDMNKDCFDLGGDDKVEDDSDTMWSILNCRLAPVMGKSERSMFYPVKFDPKDDIKECLKDYGIKMEPSALVRELKFSYEDLQKQSHILFTNGASDGWSALNYHNDINDSVVVMNFPNGAHHSELLHYWSPEKNWDTPDIRQGHEDIIKLIGKWLQEIRMA